MPTTVLLLLGLLWNFTALHDTLMVAVSSACTDGAAVRPPPATTRPSTPAAILRRFRPVKVVPSLLVGWHSWPRGLRGRTSPAVGDGPHPRTTSINTCGFLGLTIAARH